ncbi:MAG: hypothetical protein LBQ38_04455 [Spirochaetaceae bacterium]|nr:hypothetical protein [Spirochaetaceae bacterium]
MEEPWSGIYHISGDIIPIQIIESKKLPEGNLWLRDLTNDLDAGQFNRVLCESSQKENRR